MSGILNRTRVKKMVMKFLWVVRLRLQIYPEILNGNTVKWSVDSSWSTRGTLLDYKECVCWGQVVNYIHLVWWLTCQSLNCLFGPIVYIMIIDGMCCCFNRRLVLILV